jgi:hypothetical protein
VMQSSQYVCTPLVWFGDTLGVAEETPDLTDTGAVIAPVIVSGSTGSQA